MPIKPAPSVTTNFILFFSRCIHKFHYYFTDFKIKNSFKRKKISQGKIFLFTSYTNTMFIGPPFSFIKLDDA